MWPTYGENHYKVQVCGGQMGGKRKQNSLGIMKRGGTGNQARAERRTAPLPEAMVKFSRPCHHRGPCLASRLYSFRGPCQCPWLILHKRPQRCSWLGQPLGTTRLSRSSSEPAPSTLTGYSTLESWPPTSHQLQHVGEPTSPVPHPGSTVEHRRAGPAIYLL